MTPRPCPPELQRRAEAFDRVVTALRQVAALSDDDLVVVFGRVEYDIGYRMGVLMCATRSILHDLAPADAALNAELMSLDAPDVGAG